MLNLIVATSTTTDWPQWGRTPTFHSFSSVTTAPASPRPAEWSFNAGDRVVGSPAVVGERVWFGDDDGYMRCVNRTDGAVLWYFRVTGGEPRCTGTQCEHGQCKCSKVRSSPAVDVRGDNLSVVFGSYDFAVYKLDKLGKLVWRTETGGAIFGPPSIDPTSGDVYIGSFDGFLYKLDAASGAIKYKVELNAHGDSGWAIGATGSAAEGLILGVSNEGGLCTSWPPPDDPTPTPSPGGGHCFAMAIDAASGDVKWKTRTGAPGGGGMLDATGASFIAGTWNKNLTSYDVKTGAVKWSRYLFGEIQSHPALGGKDGDTVFASTEESHTLWALDAATGATKWRYSEAGEINSSPSVTADAVYVGEEQQRFCIFHFILRLLLLLWYVLRTYLLTSSCEQVRREQRQIPVRRRRRDGKAAVEKRDVC
tara:strand:+ start:69 stop:1334 length:1266 start_codon:yes stop_codon:yes gene_type:complete